MGFKNFFKSLFNSEKSNDNQNSKSVSESDFKKAIEILNNYKKTAFLPITVENKNTFSAMSKIGGFPYLRSSNDWPTCPNCQEHMQLFLQLNLEQLPKEKGKGLIQLFYCTNSELYCDSELEAFFPFSKGTVCRKIKENGNSFEIEPNISEIFNEKTIIEWESVDDFPHYEEYDELGIEIDDNVLELIAEREIGIPIQKDKLFGWPYWVQSVEYPNDRISGERMKLLFQFDSEDSLPFMFGDVGIGHLTQSPSNPDELGFGWACY